MFSDGVFACSSCCHIFRHAPSILHGFIPFAIITLRAVSMKMVNIICILSIWLIFQALALSLFHRKQHKLFTILSYRSSIIGPNIVNHCQLFFRWQWTRLVDKQFGRTTLTIQSRDCCLSPIGKTVLVAGWDVRSLFQIEPGRRNEVPIKQKSLLL